MSVSTDLADALVTLLNEADNGFSIAFEARRGHAPLTVEEIEGLRDLQVLVFTGAKKKERRTRAGWQTTYRPVIAFQKYLAGESQETVDAEADSLEHLVEEVETLLESDEADLVGLSLASFAQEQDRPQYNPEALGELKVFVTAMELEYVD